MLRKCIKQYLKTINILFFQVLSMDGTKEIAKITKCAFDNDDYLFHIDFSKTLNVRIKALLLSACFLI